MKKSERERKRKRERKREREREGERRRFRNNHDSKYILIYAIKFVHESDMKLHIIQYTSTNTRMTFTLLRRTPLTWAMKAIYSSYMTNMHCNI